MTVSTLYSLTPTIHECGSACSYLQRNPFSEACFSSLRSPPAEKPMSRNLLVSLCGHLFANPVLGTKMCYVSCL